MLNNKPVQPVALFVQYREVQELAAAERVHPADLWPYEPRGVNVAAPANTTPLRCDAPLRSLFDRLVLLVVKTQSPAGAQQLAKLSAGLSAGAAEPRAQTFWRVAAAYFEAVAHQLLPADVYVKRAASRILLQFASFAQGQNQVSETLLHDLLFFCSQAHGATPAKTPHLIAVREAFGLQAAEPVDYQLATLGRYDPAILAQARKRINAAKEAWSLFSGGDASRGRQVVDQFGLIGDSLLKLHPASTVLAQALVKAADQVAGGAPEAETDALVADVEEADTRRVPKIPLHLVIAGCPSLKTFYRGDIRHWHQLFDAACHVRPAMGISASAWEEAQRFMGPEQASIVVVAMLERFADIRSPGGYLRALTSKAAAGEFSCGPMVMALMSRRTAA